MKILFISSSARLRYTRLMMNLINIIPGLKSLTQGVAFVAVVGAASLTATPEAHAACYSGSQARSIVASNGLTPLGQVVSSIRRDGAEVTDARVCTVGNGYVYRLTVVTRNGRVKQMNVNANTGY